MGCAWVLYSALKYPGTRWLIGRSKLKSLEETTLNTFWQVCAIFGLKSNVDYVYNSQKSYIKFVKNGSVILLKDLFLYPADPNFDSLGSLEITGAFIDECNQIVEKAWNIVKSRIRYKLDENGLIPKILGSCNPSKNWVYAKFYKPFKDNVLEPFRVFIQALVTDNPHISKHYRETLLTLDNNSKERLLYGNWEYDNDPSILIPYEKILDIFTNTFVAPGEKFITADIARFGKDKTVIGVWSGYRLERIVSIAKNSIDEAVRVINELANTYAVPKSNIIADEDGVGGGVVDLVQCKGFVNNSSALENPETREKENFNNLKSQCYFKLAEFANKGRVYIANPTVEDKQAIIQELEQVKQNNMDKDTTKQVLPKEKIKELIGRSPDLSDMLMMRCWFEYNPAFEWSFG